MRRLIGIGAVMLLSMAGASGAAPPSEIANAVMNGDRAALRALLARRADVNAPQADGATALHWAVYRDELDTVDLLIGAGADVKAANRNGVTPLSMACINGNATVVDHLLKAGADANERTPRGETALMMASRTGNVAVMQLLLDRGADVNAKETLRGTTALMWAAAQEHPAAVKLLVEHGANLSAHSSAAPRGKAPYVTLGGRKAKPGEEQVLPRSANAKAEDLVGGGLTPLVYATRQNDLESVKILLAAGAKVNEVTEYGWSPLLVATQNRHYQLGSFLLDQGADPNLANKGLWTPLYLAVDNRNARTGDYPPRKGDMDHLEFIKSLLAHGADPNARIKDITETRSVFTQQWLDEDGATPFLRASMSSDLAVMRLLLAHGADPKIPTAFNVTPLQVAAGVAWVDGVTYEWSERDNIEAVKLLMDLGLDANQQNDMGLTALHGAAHKGRNAVVQLLVDHGAKLDLRDFGLSFFSPDTPFRDHGWLPVDWADGFIRIGTQSPIAHPETGLLIRKLMIEAGLPAPPMGRTIYDLCKTEVKCEQPPAQSPN